MVLFTLRSVGPLVKLYICMHMIEFINNLLLLFSFLKIGIVGKSDLNKTIL